MSNTLYVSHETADAIKHITDYYNRREQQLLDQIEMLRNALIESDHALFMKGVTMDDPIRNIALGFTNQIYTHRRDHKDDPTVLAKLNEVRDEYEYIDLNKLRHGMTVWYVYPTFGTSFDRAHCERHLTVGEPYVVRDYHIGGWESALYLKGFSGSFNSVMFGVKKNAE